MAPRRSFTQEPLRGSVVVAEDRGVLQEFVLGQHAFELFAGDEEILAPRLLAAARRPGGIADGEFQTGDDAANFIGERGFPRARGSRDDEDVAAHSRFCTCSRAFSISDFMPNPRRVMRTASPATPVVFDISVLASRFISCKRKSSFFPTSPPASSSDRKCWMWFFMRTTSS